MEIWVTRPWHSTEVTAFVNDFCIGANMELDPFLFALAIESGDPQLYDKLKKAADRVLDKMKRETAKVSRSSG